MIEFLFTYNKKIVLLTLFFSFSISFALDTILPQDELIKEVNEQNSLNFIAQQAYVKASATGTIDYFAKSVAIYGDTLVVGAHLEDSNAVGIGGDDSNNSAPSSGAVYVYTRINEEWVFDTYIKASNSQANDFFGDSVAIFQDTIVVGASAENSDATLVDGDQNNNLADNSGAVYVFKKINNQWQQQAYLKASNTEDNDRFGSEVAIYGDFIAVSAIYEDSNATHIGGDLTNNDATNAGAVYLYQLVSGDWEYMSYIKAANTGTDDQFGESIALSEDLLVVGSSNEDSISQGFGGAPNNNSASNSGAAYVYKLENGSWVFDVYIKSSNSQAGDQFGGSVGISNNTIVVGARSENSNATGLNGNEDDNSSDASGAAYVFSRSNNGIWSQQAYIKASNNNSNDNFGSTVSILDNRIIIAARGESSNAVGINGDQFNNLTSNSGAAYLFSKEDSTWNQIAYIKPFNTDVSDRFGSSISLSSTDIVLGTYTEDSSSTGVNGEDNNLLSNSGAAYVFNYLLEEIFQDDFE